MLKNCSEDFQLNRNEILNRLKLLLNNLDKNKLTRTESIEIMTELLNEEIIFGKKKLIGDYFKNAFCSYWIETIKSPVLISNIFSTNILSLRAIGQSPMPEDSPEITSTFANIERLIEELLKAIFDNTLYPYVQEKCIELIIYLIDQLFPDGTDQAENLGPTSSYQPTAKRVQELKLKIILRILDCTSLKFMSIRHTFEEIDYYITKKLGHAVTKADIP